MSESRGDYAVLLAAPEDLQVKPVSRALAVFRKIPFQDAARLARNSWGFVGEHLSKQEARELLSQLAHCGIGGLIIAHASIQEVPQEQEVFQLDVSPDGLHVRGSTGAPETISGNSITIVAAAGIKVLSTQTPKSREGPTAAARAVRAGIMMTTGLPFPVRRRKRKTKKEETTGEILFYLDLLTTEPDARYRIDAQNLDYSFLGRRMLLNSFGNFKNLLGDVIQMANSAWHSQGTRVIMKSQPISAMGYGSFADFHREVQWLWNLACLH